MLMPCSTAALIVAIDSASSDPPHIQPPMAQVPTATRDTSSEVPGIVATSIAVLRLSTWWVIDLLLHSDSAAGLSRSALFVGGCARIRFPVAAKIASQIASPIGA